MMGVDTETGGVQVWLPQGTDSTATSEIDSQIT
jgi:hypothetical protein